MIHAEHIFIFLNSFMHHTPLVNLTNCSSGPIGEVDCFHSAVAMWPRAGFGRSKQPRAAFSLTHLSRQVKSAYPESAGFLKVGRKNF